jgi:hypothetical protein
MNRTVPERGARKTIRVSNGPESVSRATSGPIFTV